MKHKNGEGRNIEELKLFRASKRPSKYLQIIEVIQNISASNYATKPTHVITDVGFYKRKKWYLGKNSKVISHVTSSVTGLNPPRDWELHKLLNVNLIMPKLKCNIQNLDIQC